MPRLDYQPTGDIMEDDAVPLDADELMLMGDRLEALPPGEAEWVSRLFRECLRARMHEAQLLENATGTDAPPTDRGCESDTQLAQVALDAAEWLKTLWDVGYMGSASFPAQPRTDFPQVDLEDVLKSSLFARIREGKRPLPFPPPTRNGLPWHDLVEGETEEHVVTAEVSESIEGEEQRALIEGCPDWLVVEEIEPTSAYVVQHRGKGPRYELCLTPFFSTLKREAPRWIREIHRQERAGVRSFMLRWLKPDETLLDVPLRAATWERAESEAAYWIATNSPGMYGQVRFERFEADQA